MSYKYAEIWGKVFECVKKYGVKAFTGWGINDSLSWLKSIGCPDLTMVTSNGEIKDFAKDFLEENRVLEATPTLFSENEIGKRTVSRNVERLDNCDKKTTRDIMNRENNIEKDEHDDPK